MSDAEIILLTCAIVFLMDIFPVPLPPTFSVMAVVYIATGVPLLPLTVLGSAAAAMGRGTFAFGVRRLKDRLPTRQRQNAFALARYVRTKVSRPVLFVAVYSFTGVTSNPLFVAVGLGALPFISPLLAFFLARSVYNTIMVALIAAGVAYLDDLGVSAWMIVLAAVGFVVGYMVLLSLPWMRWAGVDSQGVESDEAAPRA